MTLPTTAGPAPRDYHLDWLRIAALGLLIVYHVGAYYARWPWHANSPVNAVTGPWVEPLMRLSSPWRMSLLFLVSGAATAHLIGRSGASRALLRSRAKRLLLPLLLGALLIVAPQSWLEVRDRFGYTGGFGDFLALYWSAHGGFADHRGRLILPTWNHLWFLPYLFSYTAALWAWARWRPAGLTRAAAVLPQALRGWRLALWPVLVPFASLGLAGLFGRSHALVDDPSSHLLYGSAFAFGTLLANAGALWSRFEAWRWPALGVAVLAWAAQLAMARQDVLWAAANSMQGWAALIAVLGFAYRHWNRDHPWRTTLTEAVFPVYLVHQSVTIVLAVALRPLALAPLVEAVLLIGATFGFGVLFYLAVRPWPRLRPWVGLGAVALVVAAAGPARAEAPPAAAQVPAPAAQPRAPGRAGEPDIEGEWWTPGFASRVRIAACPGAPQRLCGHIVWLWDEQASVPDGLPLLQRRVVDGFKRDELGAAAPGQPAAAHYNGHLFNPEDGRRYQGRLRLATPQRLEVEGCVLMICKRQVWRRFDAGRSPPVAALRAPRVG